MPFIRYSHVFNLSQTSLYSEERQEAIPSAEELLAQMKNLPPIRTNYRRCAYDPIEDYISLPVMSAFENKEEYYSSLFHEIIHSTGHSSRLNRLSIKDSRSAYSEEELIAELGSAYLCGMCGIDNSVLSNQAAYLQGWLSKFRDEPAVLVKATITAQKVVDYLLNNENSESAFERVRCQNTGSDNKSALMNK